MIPHLVMRRALGSPMADRLFALAVARRDVLRSGRVGDATSRSGHVDSSIRNAMVIDDIDELADDVGRAIDALLPDVRAGLGVGPFEPGRKQMSMVVYGDGAFYARHKDTSLSHRARSEPRQVTFIYYFFREPKAFTGGELRLYGVRARESVDVSPERDMLVAFPSWLMHEVLPVSCPARAFDASRFALNVWVKGRAPSAPRR
jgi:Rps23 Pro-64 3,4-dihydroxylase Tpa1-like proline 4-hydroxylase